ncbi:hypothetical protein Tco_1230177, partial [Tanacetum coccineum]
KNAEWEDFTEHQIENNDNFEDEELNLEDFNSETDCEGDVEAERNKALRKLAKQQPFLEGMVTKDNFFVGRKFGDKSLVLKIVSKIAVEQRRQLHVHKNDKFKVRVKCNGQTLVFKTFNDVNPAEEGGSGPVDKQIKGVSGPIDGPIVENEKTCPWTLLVSKGSQEETWRVKTFVDNHSCLQSRDIKKCIATFLAKEVEDTIIPNPSIPTTALRDQL